MGGFGGDDTLGVMNSGETRRQAARGARPDAMDGRGNWLLVKAVSRLRLTYQIRVLVFAATSSGATLHIRVPRTCKTSRPLHDFLKQNRKHVTLERVK